MEPDWGFAGRVTLVAVGVYVCSGEGAVIVGPATGRWEPRLVPFRVVFVERCRVAVKRVFLSALECEVRALDRGAVRVEDDDDSVRTQLAFEDPRTGAGRADPGDAVGMHIAIEEQYQYRFAERDPAPTSPLHAASFPHPAEPPLPPAAG